MSIVHSRGHRFAWSHAQGTFTDAEFTTYCATVRAFLDELREPGVVLSAAFDCPPPGARQRRELAAAIDHPNAGLVAAHGVANDSAALRGVLTAIRWILPGAYPEKTFATVGEAFAWMGTFVPPAVIAEMRRDYDAKTEGRRAR